MSITEQAIGENPNQPVIDRLAILKKKQEEISLILSGLTHSDIRTLLGRIDSDISNKSVYEPQLSNLPIVHGYGTL